MVDRQAGSQTVRNTDKQWDGQTDRQTWMISRQADRQTVRHTVRQANNET